MYSSEFERTEILDKFGFKVPVYRFTMVLTDEMQNKLMKHKIISCKMKWDPRKNSASALNAPPRLKKNEINK